MLDTLKSVIADRRKGFGTLAEREVPVREEQTNGGKQMRKNMGRVVAAVFAVALFYSPAASNAVDPPDLNGTWIGYYNDGTKSEYVWKIRQIDLNLSIENVGGQTAKGIPANSRHPAARFGTR